MDSREAFGLTLRRVRVRRGVTLEAIAEATNVPMPLWEAFEENDLHGWPSGVLARAFVAEYARLIGVDVDETVDEFCRLFPQGDRRRARVMTDVADLLGQPLVWADHPPRGGERRTPLKRLREQRLMVERQELASTLVDLAAIAAVATIGTSVVRVHYATSLLVAASLYYAVSAATQTSLGATAVRLYRRQRASAASTLFGSHTRGSERSSTP